MSQPLMIGSSGDAVASPGFVQQGQVDWVAFGNTIYSASIATMQRLANAGVQPVTHGSGLVLASQFHLSELGRRRLNDALQNLKSFPAFEGVLYFGFGVQSFVRLLAETQLGINCLALCSCLTDCHSPNVAAWVLTELCGILEFPAHFEPSRQQFLALVNACSGVVASTTFGATVLVMLGQGRGQTNTIRSLFSDHGSKASRPKDIAKVLNGLFKLSKGTVESMSIVGGVECAFIAAFARWLLDLSVYVEDEQGVVIFTTVLDKEDAQVRIYYADLEGVQADMRITDTSYVLGSFKDMLSEAHESVFYLVARVPWDICLSSVFGGASLSKLLAAPHLLAAYLGGIARIYEALALGDSTVPGCTISEYRQSYVAFHPTGYGRGLIRFILALFPELALVETLQDSLYAAFVSDSLQTVVQNVDNSIRGLIMICTCHNCSTEDQLESRDSLCVVAIARTIRKLASLLAPVNRDPHLCPIDKGLVSVYGAGQTTNFSSVLDRNHIWYHLLSEFKAAEDEINTISEIFIAPFVDQTTLNRLQGPSAIVASNTALSSSGICIFINTLCAPSSRAEHAKLIHVWPGHIEWRNKHYNSIMDGYEKWARRDETLNAMSGGKADLENFSPDVFAQDPIRFETGLSASVRERTDTATLHFYYRVTLASGGHILLHPGELTDLVLRSTGILVCDRKTCDENSSVLSSGSLTSIQKGWRLSKEDIRSHNRDSEDLVCFIWPPMTDLSRCIAILVSNQCVAGDRFFIRSNDCVPCSVRSILTTSEVKDYFERRYPHGNRVIIV